MSPPRTRPKLNEFNRPFWTGGADGRLYIMQCRACDAFNHPPQPICRKCRSEDVRASAVSGKAVVETFTVNYQAWVPGLDTPIVIARVRLDEAPAVILTTNIIRCAVEDVRIGDQVQVVFEEQDGIHYPLFEKVD